MVRAGPGLKPSRPPCVECPHEETPGVGCGCGKADRLLLPPMKRQARPARLSTGLAPTPHGRPGPPLWRVGEGPPCPRPEPGLSWGLRPVWTQLQPGLGEGQLWAGLSLTCSSPRATSLEPRTVSRGGQEEPGPEGRARLPPHPPLCPLPLLRATEHGHVPSMRGTVKRLAG